MRKITPERITFIVEAILGHSIPEFQDMVARFQANTGKWPTKILLPRLIIFGIPCEFHDSNEAALYAERDK